ncbi:MAG: aldose 1-epimerase family protein [Bacteroidota bacterium]|nr:aldose 1-epimerase family protein [Bacteroidota bacterium]
MLTIENQRVKAVIHPRGAELQSIYHKGNKLEYLWGGDPAFWGKHSPILFPIVGALKEGIYYYQGNGYALGRHGFARDQEFGVESAGADSATFLLCSNADTLELYPFDFELRVAYRLLPDGLSTTYSVRNPADPNNPAGESPRDLYFSIGGHPAFNLPLQPGTDYADYYLEFDREETAPRWPISRDGLIETHSLPLLDRTRRLPLSKELFADDALVLKHPASSALTLRSSKTEHGLKMEFPGFPYLGLWAAKGADFLCIEPWCGIADSVDTNQELPEKEGINRIGPGESFERTWTLALF